MRIDILTVVPELLESPLSHSIPGRAVKKGLVEIHVHNLRKYGLGPRLTVDDYCYGGDAGANREMWSIPKTLVPQWMTSS